MKIGSENQVVNLNPPARIDNDASFRSSLVDAPANLQNIAPLGNRGPAFKFWNTDAYEGMVDSRDPLALRAEGDNGKLGGEILKVLERIAKLLEELAQKAEEGGGEAKGAGSSGSPASESKGANESGGSLEDFLEQLMQLLTDGTIPPEAAQKLLDALTGKEQGAEAAEGGLPSWGEPVATSRAAAPRG